MHMEPRTLPQRVDDAERAAAETLKHGAGLERIAPPPIQPEARRVADSTISAMRSLSDLSGYGRGMEPNMRRGAAETASPVASAPATRQKVPSFEEASRGHSAPESAFDNVEDARDHSTYVVVTGQRLLEANPSPSPIILSQPLPELARMAMEEPDETRQGADAGRARTVSGWLTESFLGTVAYGRFTGTPPIVTTESPAFFEINNAADGTSGGGNGLYMRGTNHIMITTDIANPADRMCVIAHETLHYAAYLGGGNDGIRFRDAAGGGTVLGEVPWLHEGMTELLAQQLVRSHDTTPSYVGYPAETLTAYYLQQIAGEGTLRAAYVSGDFTAVRQAVDARLGDGAFASLSRMDNGTDALAFLMGRMDEHHVDRSVWDRNPVARIAWSTPFE
jgi:hypothetical protein